MKNLSIFDYSIHTLQGKIGHLFSDIQAIGSDLNSLPKTLQGTRDRIRLFCLFFILYPVNPMRLSKLLLTTAVGSGKIFNLVKRICSIGFNSRKLLSATRNDGANDDATQVIYWLE